MFPKYQEIQIPLLFELKKRGGKAKPSTASEDGKTIYDALADEFELSEEARSYEILENNGTPRSKWKNMVRWTRNDLRKLGYLNSPTHGVWQITGEGLSFLEKIDNEKIGDSILDSNLFVSPEKFNKQKAEAEKIGRLGEDFVYNREKTKLRDIGREDLANKVKMICNENVAAGFDILSFNEKEEEKYIEVKTTVREHYRFEVTANEIAKAEKLQDSYWIYRVTKIKSENPKVKEIQNPARLISEQKLLIKPTSFLMTVGEEL